MGILQRLGISTRHEGQHAAGKHEAGKSKPPRVPKTQTKTTKK